MMNINIFSLLVTKTANKSTINLLDLPIELHERIFLPGNKETFPKTCYVKPN